MLMCMCMLTKRTQILLEEETWKKLAKLASEKETSIGELIRDAVEEKYLEMDKLERRREAIEKILRIRPKPSKTRIDYKELINAGRKY